MTKLQGVIRYDGDVWWVEFEGFEGQRDLMDVVGLEKLLGRYLAEGDRDEITINHIKEE